MADPTPRLDAAAQAALSRLADIASPAPVSWMPHTWGWVALALLLLGLLIWMAVHHHRRRVANRYRREALAELAAIEARLADAATRAPALAALPPLLKRTALAAWPRAEVASLAGKRWLDFLHAHGGGAQLPPAIGVLLDDAEYRPGAAIDAQEARLCAEAVRTWISRHRNPPKPRPAGAAATQRRPGTETKSAGGALRRA